MNKNLIYLLGGLILGILGTHLVVKYHLGTNNSQVEMSYNSSNLHSTMQSTMAGMSADLKGKSGLEFDKAFLKEMITHHQGAIEMANLALANAQHQELKDMAKDIITAQAGEIKQMEQWKIEWNK